ncbi:MAG: maleate cis-trans isomerase family protein [Nocardioidaceae bacterium]
MQGSKWWGSGVGEDLSVGVIVPYDFALDREIWRWTPDDMTLLITRTHQLGLPSNVAMATHISTDETLRELTDDLLAVEPEVVLYLCTSGSFVRGVAGERHMREVMCAAGAPLALTTAGALLDALRHLGIRRLGVATPYIASVTERLVTFLTEADVTVTSSRGLGLTHHIWRVPPTELRTLVLAADDPDADAVFVSCTNLKMYDLIPSLEAELGKPVLCANQVSMWATLRAVGVTPPYNGQRLFA